MEKSQIKVAVLIPAYKEPENVIERILSACHGQKLNGGEYNIDLQVWFCVDGMSAQYEERINVLAKSYGVNISKRPNRAGFRAGALNYCIKNNLDPDTKYIIALDVDQAPTPDMTKVLVQQMELEKNRGVHFIMFPQVAENAERNAITKASDTLQRYDYYFNRRIRCKTNSAFVVGTNWIGRADFIRKCPLEEGSIVEDQASSVKWHGHGAVIRVINAELAKGLAPDTIESWRAQQARWSYGALYNLRYLKKHWKDLTFWQRLDYASVMLWYLYAIPALMAITIPLLAFVAQVSTADQWVAMALLFVNIIVSMLPMIYCKEKGLTIKEIIQTSFVQHICLDLYIKSLIDNIRGKRFSYVVSDKTGKSIENPHRSLWFSYLLVAITTMGIIYALYLNPPTMERFINALNGAPLKYTTYIIYWLILAALWIWGAVYYAHISRRICDNVQQSSETVEQIMETT